jgi:hypothetical protein
MCRFWQLSAFSIACASWLPAFWIAGRPHQATEVPLGFRVVYGRDRSGRVNEGYTLRNRRIAHRPDPKTIPSEYLLDEDTLISGLFHHPSRCHNGLGPFSRTDISLRFSTLAEYGVKAKTVPAFPLKFFLCDPAQHNRLSIRLSPFESET